MLRLVVISPHLDDGIFSCGSLIAAASLVSPALIVTVCAGIPEAGLLTGLDASAGFSSSADAVRVRRAEDAAAAALLGANVLHLDVLDEQYARSGDLAGETTRRAREISRALTPVLASVGTVCVPLGIRHPDHLAVAEVCAYRADLLYAELPYGALWAEHAPQLDVPALVLPNCTAKAQAVLCYRSQLGDGPPGPELADDERYYRREATR